MDTGRKRKPPIQKAAALVKAGTEEQKRRAAADPPLGTSDLSRLVLEKAQRPGGMQRVFSKENKAS